MGLWDFLLNFPNLPFDFSRCAAPGLRSHGISREVNHIRKLHVLPLVHTCRVSVSGRPPYPRNCARSRMVWRWLGELFQRNLFMILRRNLPRAYRASGGRFSIPTGRQVHLYKIKTWRILHRAGREGHRVSRWIVLVERDSLGLTGSGPSLPLKNIF